MTTALRVIRRELDLTQERLAAAVGIDRSHISRIERGLKPAAPKLRRRLAAELGADPWNPPQQGEEQ
jgi:transcriptional regulator with XRE-family HTH domain